MCCDFGLRHAHIEAVDEDQSIPGMSHLETDKVHPQIRYKWTISQDTCKVFKFFFWRGFSRWIGGSNLLQSKSGWNMNVKLRRTWPKQFVGLFECMVETLADFGLRAGASATSTGSPRENARKHGKVVKWTRRRSLCLTEIDWVVSWKVHACHSPAQPACQGLQQKLHPCHVASQKSNGMFYHELLDLVEPCAVV